MFLGKTSYLFFYYRKKVEFWYNKNYKLVKSLNEYEFLQTIFMDKNRTLLI